MSSHTDPVIDLNGLKLKQPKAIESTYNYLSKVYLPWTVQRLSKEDYEDIANEVLLIVYEGMKITEVEHQSYIQTIAKNLAIRLFKQGEKMPTVRLKQGTPSAPETDAISKFLDVASITAWEASQTSQETKERFEEDASEVLSELSLKDQAFVAALIQAAKQDSNSDSDSARSKIANKLGLTTGNLNTRKHRITKKVAIIRKRRKTDDKKIRQTGSARPS